MSALHGLWKRLPVWIRSGCLILSSRKLAHVFRASDFHVKAVIRKTDKDVFVYDVLPASEEPVVAGIAIGYWYYHAFPPLSLIC